MNTFAKHGLTVVLGIITIWAAWELIEYRKKSKGITTQTPVV